MKERYSRNLCITTEEQKRLFESRVAVIGCGGLGGVAVECLARAGVGNLVICDSDVFSVSNLNRQLLCTEDNLGKSKAEEAKERVKKINSEVCVTAVNARLTKENVASVIGGCAVVIDAADNVETKKLLKSVCRELKIPLVHGGISGWFGQVTIAFSDDEIPDEMFSETDSDDFGNLSVTACAVGAVEAAEAVKAILAVGEALSKRAVFIDLLSGEFREVKL